MELTYDACGVIGRDGVGLVACGFASCERCVGSLHSGDRAPTAAWYGCGSCTLIFKHAQG